MKALLTNGFCSLLLALSIATTPARAQNATDELELAYKKYLQEKATATGTESGSANQERAALEAFATKFTQLGAPESAARVRARLALLELQAGRLEAAEKAVARAQQGLPNTRKRLQAQLQLIAARTFQQQGRYDHALRAYARAAALAEQSALGSAVGYDPTLNALFKPLQCSRFSGFDPKRDSLQAVTDRLFVQPTKQALLPYSVPSVVMAWFDTLPSPTLPSPFAELAGECQGTLAGQVDRATSWRSTAAPDSETYADDLIPKLELLTKSSDLRGATAKRLLGPALFRRGVRAAERGQPDSAKRDLERALELLYREVNAADGQRIAALYALAKLGARENRSAIIAYLERESSANLELGRQAALAKTMASGSAGLWRQLQAYGIGRRTAMAYDPTTTSTLETLADQASRTLQPVMSELEIATKILLPLGVARVYDGLGEYAKADSLRATLQGSLANERASSSHARSVFQALLHADLAEREENQGFISKATQSSELAARHWAKVLRQSVLTFDVGYVTSRPPVAVFERAVSLSLRAFDTDTAFELSELARSLVDPLPPPASDEASERERLDRDLTALEAQALAGAAGPKKPALMAAIENARLRARQQTTLVSPLSTADIRLQALRGHASDEALAALETRLDAYEQIYQNSRSQEASHKAQAAARTAAERSERAVTNGSSADVARYRERAFHQDQLLQLRNALHPSSPSVRGPSLRASDLRAALAPSESLLGFWFGPSELFAFVHDQRGTSGLCLPGVSRAALSALTLRASGGNASALRSLYDVLIAPLREKLVGTRLVLVTDDVLNDVPLEALSDGKRYLFQDFEIRRVPRAGDRLAKAHSPHTIQRLFAAAQPEAAGLPRLEHARAELATVSAHFPTLQPIIDPSLSESNFRLRVRDAQLLHLAAHADSTPNNPLFSRLRLGSDSQHDGALDAHEIADLGLSNLELVVLSACDTAVTTNSLAAAFFRAGASSVVASLWSLNDESTRAFMAFFYAALARPGTSKSAALNEARWKMLQIPALAATSAWAGFVLIGDPAALVLGA